jgi:anti-sigma B factor antagonist
MVDPDGSKATVVATGELDLASLPDLRSVVRLAWAQGVRSIDIDVGEVRYVNSAALRLLGEIHAAAVHHGGRLSIVDARDNALRMLLLDDVTRGLTVAAPDRPDDYYWPPERSGPGPARTTTLR